MATPTAFTADMLKDMAKLIDDYQPRQSLLASAGFKREMARLHDMAAPPLRANHLTVGRTQSYMGIEIVPVDIPPEEVIDWSGCRSPSRARRRHARGIPQRITIKRIERAYLINRDMIDKWARDLDARMIAALMYGG